MNRRATWEIAFVIPLETIDRLVAEASEVPLWPDPPAAPGQWQTF